MTTLSHRISMLPLAWLLVTSINPARADTVYTYTGQPFTIAASPYTTDDFVSAVLTTATPLAPNLPLSGISLISLSLSDGVQTIDLQLSTPLSSIRVGQIPGVGSTPGISSSVTAALTTSLHRQPLR